MSAYEIDSYHKRHSAFCMVMETAYNNRDQREALLPRLIVQNIPGLEPGLEPVRPMARGFLCLPPTRLHTGKVPKIRGSSPTLDCSGVRTMGRYQPPMPEYLAGDALFAVTER